jgi:hypothetical protein
MDYPYDERVFHPAQSSRYVDWNHRENIMAVRFVSVRRHPSRVLALVSLLALGSGVVAAKDVKVNLVGAEETPPVTTTAAGHGTIHIAKDGSVSGSIKTTGVEGIAAHIHQGAKGEAGPPIITLTKGVDGSWSVPAGAKLTDDQLAAFKDGKLYVNVHSDQHKPGEIRAQLTP